VLSFAPQARLAHLPFYEALAELDESTDEWRALSAGLLSVRLFDRWVEERGAGRRLSRWELSGVAEAVEAVAVTSPVRSILRSFVAGVGASESPATVLPILVAYGRTLQHDALWTPAADVYQTVTLHATDDDLAMSSAYLRGFCLRTVGDLDGALRSYETGRALAVRSADLSGMLQADVSLAAIASHKGNLPAAEATLDTVIARAEPEGAPCAFVLSRALHDRGVVAARRGRPDEAVGYCHRALDLCERPVDRERILGDMGVLLKQVGDRAAARDTHMILYATARASETRLVAALNLMELAAADENEPLFERYRRGLVDAALPPVYQAYYELYVGDGHARFGRREAARESWLAAARTAEAHSVNQVRLMAEERLLRHYAGSPTESPEPQRAASPVVRNAARAVRQLRELAEAGAPG
jgi:tetratricopeptide (TPR) repeat protein